MTFAEASAFKMPFGRHICKTLDQVAEKDSGLLYLDWLRGEIEAGRFGDTGTPTHDALIAYLDDPTITADVLRVVKGHA